MMGPPLPRGLRQGRQRPRGTALAGEHSVPFALQFRGGLEVGQIGTFGILIWKGNELLPGQSLTTPRPLNSIGLTTPPSHFFIHLLFTCTSPSRDFRITWNRARMTLLFPLALPSPPAPSCAKSAPRFPPQKSRATVYGLRQGIVDAFHQVPSKLSFPIVSGALQSSFYRKLSHKTLTSQPQPQSTPKKTAKPSPASPRNTLLAICLIVAPCRPSAEFAWLILQSMNDYPISTISPF